MEGGDGGGGLLGDGGHEGSLVLVVLAAGEGGQGPGASRGEDLRGAVGGDRLHRLVDPVQVLQVLGAISFISELVATYMALEGALSCVSSVVVLELTPRLKALLADITDEPCLPRVQLEMALEKV